MTESNITREHEGKHGVLTLGGVQHLEGMIAAVMTGSFTVRLDRSEFMNGFFLSDGWQFTPDPDPLPTEPGWYVRTSNLRFADPPLYSLGSGGWRCHSHNTGSNLRNVEHMTNVHAADPLVRVSFADAS